MEILMDTSVVIDHLRKTNKITTFFRQISEQHTLYISTVSKFELDIGVTAQSRVFFDNIYEDLILLPFTDSCVNCAVEIYHKLKKQNQLIGMADLLIASTAIARDLSLATLNIKHFSRIDGLKLLPLTTNYQ